jgi:hypothetical protein
MDVTKENPQSKNLMTKSSSPRGLDLSYRHWTAWTKLASFSSAPSMTAARLPRTRNGAPEQSVGGGLLGLEAARGSSLTVWEIAVVEAALT